MKYLVIGDTHFKYDLRMPSYLESQIRNILGIIQNFKVNRGISHVVFLGDLFERRTPLPQDIIEVNKFIEAIKEDLDISITVLRGNHDTLYKGKDSTATPLDIFRRKAQIIYKCYRNTELDFFAVSHFDTKEPILECLEYCKKLGKLPKWTFGHFGYNGCIPGDHADTEIDLDDFISNTILGHIHTHNILVNNSGHKIILLGIPHPVCFMDVHEDYYVAVIDSDTGDISIEEITSNIVFKVVDLDTWTNEEIENYLNSLKKKYFVSLRLVSSSHISEKKPIIDFIRARCNELKLGNYIEHQYKSSMNKIGDLSQEEFEINSVLDRDFLEKYAQNNVVNMEPKILLDSLGDILDDFEKTKD